MIFSCTQPLRPEITDTTPTSVATPMMMPSRVRKLRRRLARIACTASRGRSDVNIMTRPGGRLLVVLLLLLLRLHRVARLQRAQRLEGPLDQGLAARKPGEDLQRQLAEQPGLDGLELRLAAVVQEHPFLVAGGTGRGVARLHLAVADDQGLDGDHERLGAEAGQDVRGN